MVQKIEKPKITLKGIEYTIGEEYEFSDDGEKWWRFKLIGFSIPNANPFIAQVTKDVKFFYNQIREIDEEEYDNDTSVHEIAMISSIISNTICKKLYKKVQEEGYGYTVTNNLIASWAVEFYNLHINTNWVEVLEDLTLEPLSPKTKILACWDDVVVDFAKYKLKEY